MPKGLAHKRIPVTPEILQQMQDLRLGLGSTHDEALSMLLKLVIKPGESALDAGRRLRDDYLDNKLEPEPDTLAPRTQQERTRHQPAALLEAS